MTLQQDVDQFNATQATQRILLQAIVDQCVDHVGMSNGIAIPLQVAHRQLQYDRREVAAATPTITRAAA